MNYTDISKVNSEIKMLDLKGKDYAMVPERVTAFRKLFPDGFITTEIIHLSDDGTVVLMKATAGYYREDGSPVVLGSGMAKEVQGKGMVNGTSHIENCETSAVGRALGMIGLGLNGGGICSAEELVNAITAQNQMKAQQQKPAELQQVKSDFVAPKASAPAKVDTGNKVPETSNEAADFLKLSMKQIREARGVSVADNNKWFKDHVDALVNLGLAPKKSLKEYTLDEAAKLIETLYARFPIEGESA